MRSPVSIEDILNVVSDQFDIPKNLLVSRHRGLMAISDARQAAFALAREFTTKSYAQIGWHIGHRDHTTVAYGVKRAKGRKNHDAEFAEAYAKCRYVIGQKVGPFKLGYQTPMESLFSQSFAWRLSA